MIGSKDKATQLACAFTRTSVRVVAKRANGVTVRYRSNHAKIACGASLAGALTCAFLVLPSMAVRALIGGACDAATETAATKTAAERSRIKTRHFRSQRHEKVQEMFASYHELKTCPCRSPHRSLSLPPSTCRHCTKAGLCRSPMSSKIPRDMTDKRCFQWRFETFLLHSRCTPTPRCWNISQPRSWTLVQPAPSSSRRSPAEHAMRKALP